MQRIRFPIPWKCVPKGFLSGYLLEPFGKHFGYLGFVFLAPSFVYQRKGKNGPKCRASSEDKPKTTKTVTYMLAEISRNISLLSSTGGAAAPFAIPRTTLATML